jgi:TonB family protein
MSTPSPKTIAALVLIAALAGCATTEKMALQPMQMPMPVTPPGVYDISQVSVPPRPTFQARPQYPFALRRAGATGEGVIVFIVRRDGNVGDAVIFRASDIRFGEAALAAVVQWRFQPAQLRGVPVDCMMMVPIVFTLDQQ